jgi:PAB-dependent poly(A)-specific ribonuclease subunit 2
LLEGVRGERGAADIVVETHKDRSLGRRCQRLARFLLEQLSKEAAAASAGAGGGGGGGGVGGGGGGGRAPPAPGAAAPAGPTPIEEVFALGQRQRTRCLSRPRPDQDKLTRAFQVDLQYPPPKERPGSGGAAAAAGAPPRPSFAQLLQRSLYTCAEMRAWFDPEVGYQLVRQEKVPAALPQVLVVSCGLEDRGDLAWWAPVAGGEPAAGRGASSPPRRPRARAWLPFALAITADPEGWAVEVEEAGSAAEAAARCGGAAAPAGGVRAVYELTAVVAHVVDEDEAEEAGAAGYEGHLLAHVRVPPAYYEAQQESPVTSRPPSRGPAEPEPAPAPPGSPPATPPPPSAAALDEEEPVTPGGPERGAAGAAWRPPGGGGGGRYEWLVFNDFHISPSLASEVAELYGGQKVPVLLYFSRADVTAAAAAAPPAPPTPALTPAAFLALCAAPPLQPARARLHRPAFVPLSPSEDAPRPGTLLALDAEFVAYSPPERVVRRGVEVEARPSRLGLGRVSVVRGEGPLAGTPLIDDYIRSVEPVFDHLTRYSGLLPGDLDPAHSRHHLTTLRAAYLKLRHLVDAGCVFVGHGLKKDFRMINIVVPPSQVVDTMDLFYSGRGRRLSLRFLSAYLLGAAIQGGSHDSVEDAVAALRLYRAYRGLAEEGRVEGALREMMEWGAAHGWDPSGWGQPPPHLAAAAPAAAAVAAARPAGTWGLR